MLPFPNISLYRTKKTTQTSFLCPVQIVLCWCIFVLLTQIEERGHLCRTVQQEAQPTLVFVALWVWTRDSLFLNPIGPHNPYRSHNKGVYMPCGFIPQICGLCGRDLSEHSTCEQDKLMCEFKQQWSNIFIFLVGQLHWTVRKCPTIPTPEVQENTRN